MRKCRYCGMPMEDDDLFCTRCGKPVDTEAVQEGCEEKENFKDILPEKGSRKRITAAAAAAVILIVFFIAISKGFSGQDPAAGGQQNIAQADEGPAARENNKEGENTAFLQEASKEAPGEDDLKTGESNSREEISGIEQISPEQEEQKKQEEQQKQEEQDMQAMQNDDSAGGAGDNTYILPGSDSRYYSWGDLDALDNDTLQMAINELYARHGRRFETESIRTYFENKSWYKPSLDPSAIDGNEDVYFNEYEKANYQLLIQVRGARTAPAPVQDNGEDNAQTGDVGD